MKEFFKYIVISILFWETSLVLERKKPFIIGVTGNLGKTSTKDAIYAVMKDHFNVRRGQKSFNSEFGLPLTVLGAESAWGNPFMWIWVIMKGFFVLFEDEYPTHLILEIGADRPGDIKKITRIVKPDIAVVTQFGQIPVHIEFFANRDEVVKEKGYLVEALKEGGLFIWNADDNDAKTLLAKTTARKVSVGINEQADVKADNVKLYGEPIEGTEAEINAFGEVYKLNLKHVAGKSPVYACLPAIAVAKEFGIPLTSAIKSLMEVELPKGRMRILKGMNNSTIIDDTYNASPKATEHGLKTLEEIQTKGRKIAVLGDMLELGEFSKDEHYKMGKEAAKVAHLLFTVGIRARVMADGALDAKMKDKNIMQCDNSISAGKELVEVIKEGDVIYVKGSQGVRMERAVKMILAETHDPRSVLVRQDKEWLKR